MSGFDGVFGVEDADCVCGRMTRVGLKEKGERQRMYQYALVDAKDEPWVTFRYLFCSGGEWTYNMLGVLR